MNTLELIINYKNIIDYKNKISLKIDSNFNMTDLSNSLKELLNDEDTFLKYKELIFDMEQYPLFIYCSKLYSSHYYDRFNETDKNSYQLLFNYLVDTMIYLNTLDTQKIITNYNIEDIPTLASDTSLNNRLLSLKNYNSEYFKVLYTSASNYFKLYTTELNSINNSKDSEFINNFHALFKRSKTYHFKIKMINNLYLLLDSTFKEKIQSIIYFYLNSSSSSCSTFKDEFENLEMAYKYKNTKQG